MYTDHLLSTLRACDTPSDWSGLHMKIHALHRLAPLLVIVVAAASGFACDSIYYKTMKKFGKEKRDILVGRVKDARESQDEAQQQFKSALERFQAIVATNGGSLEEV